MPSPRQTYQIREGSSHFPVREGGRVAPYFPPSTLLRVRGSIGRLSARLRLTERRDTRPVPQYSVRSGNLSPLPCGPTLKGFRFPHSCLETAWS